MKGEEMTGRVGRMDSMGDLAEFLLACFAEDETSTFELIPYGCEPGCCAPAGWVGHRCLICGTEEFGGTVQAITEIAHEHEEKIHQRSRVLAECDAKRRIVELHALARTMGHQCVAIDGPTQHHMADPCATLRLLALPYANHPSYRSEWKP